MSQNPTSRISLKFEVTASPTTGKLSSVCFYSSQPSPRKHINNLVKNVRTDYLYPVHDLLSATFQKFYNFFKKKFSFFLKSHFLLFSTTIQHEHMRRNFRQKLQPVATFIHGEQHPYRQTFALFTVFPKNFFATKLSSPFPPHPSRAVTHIFLPLPTRTRTRSTHPQEEEEVLHPVGNTPE